VIGGLKLSLANGEAASGRPKALPPMQPKHQNAITF